MTTVAVMLDVFTVILLLHTCVNAWLLRRPPRHATVDEHVTVVLPVRDEEERVVRSLPALLAQRGLTSYDVVVCNDGSTDRTVEVVRRLADRRVTVVDVPPPPPGWLGKPHACAAGAAGARGSVLVFVDADVVVTPEGLARAVALLRVQNWGFVSPYPRQETGSLLERLVQPLLQWSWLTFLPLRLSERSPRPSLVAGNGQLLVVDAETYRRAGGHAAVRADVVEDVALARALRRAGARGTFAEGSDLATCRMYESGRALVDGYAKSLWTAFGSPAGGLAVSSLLLVLGVAPWLLVTVTPWAWPAVLAGVAGRLVTALRSGGRPLVDVVLHPLSVVAFAALVALSVLRHRRGRLQWKARPVG